RVPEHPALQLRIDLALPPPRDLTDLGPVDASVVELPVAEVHAPRAADPRGGGHHREALQRGVEAAPAPADAHLEASADEQYTRVVGHGGQRLGEGAELSPRVPADQACQEPAVLRVEGNSCHRGPPWLGSMPPGTEQRRRT